jgi:hypothetical protein
MQPKDQNVKAFAISRLLAGDSYRKTQTAVKEQYGETVAPSTLSAWANEQPEQAQAISQVHLRAVGHGRVRVALKALDMLEDAIDNGAIPLGQIPVTYGIVQDKLDSMLKIVADNRNTNEKVEAIREQLRGKTAHELKALAEAMPETSPPPSVNHDHDHDHDHDRDHDRFQEERRARAKQLERYRSLEN